MKARLILEDGTVFNGKAFGYLEESVGEVGTDDEIDVIILRMNLLNYWIEGSIWNNEEYEVNRRTYCEKYATLCITDDAG